MRFSAQKSSGPKKTEYVVGRNPRNDPPPPPPSPSDCMASFSLCFPPSLEGLPFPLCPVLVLPLRNPKKSPVVTLSLLSRPISGSFIRRIPHPFCKPFSATVYERTATEGGKKRSNSALLIAASISPIPSFPPLPLSRRFETRKRKGKKERSKRTASLERRRREREKERETRSAVWP